jgi:hypothetical protein
LRHFLCILILLASTFCKAQDITRCIVYQFAGNDSNKKHIALTQTFNRRAQIVWEKYLNYKSSSSEGYGNGTYRYYYTDSLLTKRLFADNKDTTKVLYYYNNRNQCIKEQNFSWERRLKKNVKTDDIFEQIPQQEDFEKKRTWIKTNEVTISYDGKGRRIKKADEEDYTHFWKYDESNRVIQEKGYDDNKLVYVEDYTYFNGGYKYSTVWYDDNEKPQTPKYSDIDLSSIYTFTFYLDKKGRIIKKEITTEKGEIDTEITDYDKKGRIAKTIYLDAKGQPEITHIFEYE